jgi:hypothetical protein
MTSFEENISVIQEENNFHIDLFVIFTWADPSISNVNESHDILINHYRTIVKL